jgi:hypothetical protein
MLKKISPNNNYTQQSPQTNPTQKSNPKNKPYKKNFIETPTTTTKRKNIEIKGQQAKIGEYRN